MIWRLRMGLRLAWHYATEAVRSVAGRKPPYALLRVPLRGELSEGYSPAPFGVKVASSFFELAAALRLARDDERLRGVFVHCDQAALGWAQVQELHRSLLALRRAGKRVYVALGQATLAEYVLASAADTIFLSPAGGLEFAGLTAEAWFFRRALEKLGIQAEIVQVGEYKSAAEVFTRTSMSEAHRQAMQALVDDLIQQLGDAIAAGRGCEGTRAVSFIEGGPYDPLTAQNLGLVDALVDPGRGEARACEELGVTAREVIDLTAYMRRKQRELRPLGWSFRGEHLAILHIVGSLFEGTAPWGKRVPSATSILCDLEQIREDPRVRAVVVRVVSPGGSALLSDRLWHGLARVGEKKPVVASLGDVAVSGGYYVAVAGQPIFAEGASLTGSIGVLAGKFVLRALYQWLGVDKDRVARGKHTGLGSDFYPLTDNEREVLRRSAHTVYSRFTHIVGTARQLTTTTLDAVAGGRVWTGRAAREAGLVDEIGGIQQAVDAAKLLVGWRPDQPAPVVHYPRPRSFWQILAERTRPSPPLPLPPTTGSRPDVWAWFPVEYRFR